jgi:hypothetical protein
VWINMIGGPAYGGVDGLLSQDTGPERPGQVSLTPKANCWQQLGKLWTAKTLPDIQNAQDHFPS